MTIFKNIYLDGSTIVNVPVLVQYPLDLPLTTINFASLSDIMLIFLFQNVNET